MKAVRRSPHLTQPTTRRPDDVVPKHHRRAVALWMLLIIGILAYASWQFAGAMEKRKNPSTSFVLSNTVYTYPDVWVCLYETYGCDEQRLEKQCRDSSDLTAGGSATATFHPGGEHEKIIPAVGTGPDSKGWCLEYKTSEVTTFLGEERNAGEDLDYFTLNASWYPGGGPGNSTTCVTEGETWRSHSEWVYIFLVDPATNVPSTGIQISYSCMTEESNSHVFTYMGIGLNEQHNIDKDNSVSYKALSVTSSVRKDEVNEGITDPYAYLEVQMQQEPDSWEIVTEIDPLNVGEILGSIGGFWDLILILWPIFFVAATRQDPHLKPRDFRRSAQTAAGGVTGFMGVTASVPEPLKRTMASGGKGGREIDLDATERQIERPYWETTPPDTRSAEELDV